MEKLYHVYNRSIEEVKIFTDNNEYMRFKNAIRFYRIQQPHIKFSDFIGRPSKPHRPGGVDWHRFIDKKKLVEIIAYCIMPTHFHMVLLQLENNGIATFINNILNSYTRYYNTKHERKGPLWEGPTKKVLIEKDSYMLHLTRYIHLNPVTAYLVNRPDEWSASSYNEYLLNIPASERICNCYQFLNIAPDAYKKFVEDGIAYQRELAKAKKDNYTDPVWTGKPTAPVGLR